jgi:hypothetical protein
MALNDAAKETNIPGAQVFRLPEAQWKKEP